MLKQTILSRSLQLAFSVATLTVAMAPTAFAQSSEGSLYGEGKPGTPVTIVNRDTGLQRQTAIESSGNFAFSKLPPGRYSVTSGGVTREVEVTLGAGTQVNLMANQLERVAVTGSSRVVVDVKSVESNTAFSAEQLQRLPVARDVNAVAFLAPGVVKGDAGLGAGGIPSFGGASVGENGYYINGFDVTNIRNFLSYANLPFDAIEQQQMKTGGYGAEYGRSLGGVISILTKSGTNEWKGGASAYYTPNIFRSVGRDVLDKDPQHPGQYYRYNSADAQTDLNFNIYGGGPIIKDRLFIFGLIEGRKDTTDVFRQSTATHTVQDKPNGMVKVNWNITDNHILEYTGITNNQAFKITDYTSVTPYSSAYQGAGRDSKQVQGSTVNILKYTGYITDDFTVSVLGGRTFTKSKLVTGARVENQDCPVILETNAAEIGCWAMPFPGNPVRDSNSKPYDTDKREAGRLDLEYVLGNHTLRGGLDYQKFTAYSGAESTYSGGYYYRYFISANGSVNGVPNVVAPGGQYVRRRETVVTGGSFDVINTASYIEDSWKVGKNWLLYGGLRAESFENRNSEGTPFVKKDNLIAPRLGFSWDVNGDASLKVYGNAGRYFIPVAANTNVRATRSEKFEQRFYTFTGRDTRTQGPLGLSAQDIGSPQIVSSGALPDPATVADTNLQPMNQDEFILGFQKAISKNLTVGVKGTYRKVNDGMDDYCGHYAQHNWAVDQGLTDFDPSNSAQCILVNPGRDVSIKVDKNGDGNLTSATIPAKYFNLAKYERKYQALEVTIERPFNGVWALQGSYVWSKSTGTAEGYVQSTLQQEDAGLTQDFDFGSFTDGAKGPLPNDRRHVIKLFGTYQLSPVFRVGGNMTVSSGRPLSCIGYVPSTVPDYNGVDGWAGSKDYTSASSYYCVNPKTGQSELHSRGSAGRTPWTAGLDLSFAYTPKIGLGQLTLQVDVFNVLNSQRPTRLNEVADYSRADVGKAAYNYMSPTDFQDARSVQFSARYQF